MLSELLKLLFPPQCRICGKRGADLICKTCMNGFPELDATNTCKRCGKPAAARNANMNIKLNLTNNMTCRECENKNIYSASSNSAGSYEGLLKKAILQLKYKNGKLLAPYLATFMQNAANNFANQIDVVTYVPLTKRKEAYRGYNQSRLLANELSRIIEIPCCETLIRLQDKNEQNKSSFAARTSNVTGAFRISDRFNNIETIGSRILLIDDVFTTGSTVNECARVLQQAGASKVFVLTLARTPSNKSHLGV